MPSSALLNLLPKISKKKIKPKKKKSKKKSKNGITESEEECLDFSNNGFEFELENSSKSHFIQPLGNLLLFSDGGAAVNIRDSGGLGSLSALSDDILLDSLLPLLPARDLATLSAASKSLYVFSTHDPLWRSLLLAQCNGDFDFDFSGSWRSTFIAVRSSLRRHIPGRIEIKNFYSDYLFQSWLCANLAMKSEWLEIDNIPRRNAKELSLQEFVSKFEEPNAPVLIEDCVSSWPAMRKWGRENLIETCAGVKFAVGPVEMTMEKYFLYAEKAKEERPLYMFDPKFSEKVPELGLDYEVPEYFREDLFGVLGKERPDYRWIIIGPTGSGSSFHVDPNSTSAWNAVIRGSKKWVMFPPEVVPPGVHPSPDGVEVACPVSIMEWFMNFYGECRKLKKRHVECVCKAGEVVFVPNGWWHLVINLEDSIAITQNYVSRRNLLNVLDFLKKPNASELVSGTRDRVHLYDKFRTAMETAFPGTIDELTSKAEEKKAQQKKPTFWESVVDTNTGGFKFSF